MEQQLLVLFETLPEHEPKLLRRIESSGFGPVVVGTSNSRRLLGGSSVQKPFQPGDRDIGR